MINYNLKREDFDSDEELYFYWWTCEAARAGFILDVIHQPESWLLYQGHSFTELAKTSRGASKVKTLIQPSRYTCDALIVWTDKSLGVLCEAYDFETGSTQDNGTLKRLKAAPFIAHRLKDALVSYVEVKPSFDRNNMTRLVNLNIKFVMHKYNTFVNLVQPIPLGNATPKSALFLTTFTPKRFFFCNKNQLQLRRIHFKVDLIESFLLKNSLT